MLTSDYFGISGKVAYFSREVVEIMEPAVVGARRHAGHSIHFVKFPWGEDKQAPVGASIETLSFRFPIGAYRIFLYVDEWITSLQTFVFHQQLTA